MSNFVGYIKSAIKQMKHNGSKTLMTMLGIIIGIAAVITVVTLGSGMQQYVMDQFNKLNGNYAELTINQQKTNDFFTEEDVKLVEEELSGIKGITPIYVGNGKVKGDRGICHANVYGGNGAMEYFFSKPIIKGKYFTKQQVEAGENVCVIDRDDAKELFKTEDCVGKELELSIGDKTATYTVVGMKDRFDSLAKMSLGEEHIAFVEVPYTAYAVDYGQSIDKWYDLLLFADQDVLQEKCDKAGLILNNAHGGRGSNVVKANTLANISDMIDDYLGTVKGFLIAVALISLIVGGIGIMNIMLVSVAERTREIGIRKSIGARTGAITMQFLTESAILTLLAGIIGIVVGIGLSNVLCLALKMKPVILPESVVIAAGVSITIGIFFGLYPARKAAKMKPIDALRV